MRCRIALTAMFAVTVAGCASWKDTGTADVTAEQQLTKRIKNKKRLVLDVEFANLSIPSNDLDQSAAIWQWVDETAIDAGVRRRLLANGIRVGIVADEQQFRSRIADSTSQPDVVDTFLNQASIASEVSHGEKRIPMRFGRRYELPLHKPIEGNHVSLVRLGEETIGRTFANAQYLFAITALESDTPQQVNLRFRPEIQHGATRQKFVSSDSAIRIDARRETWSIPELDVDLNAAEDNTIVFAADTPITGMAKHMFTGSASDQQQQQTIVLIRVAQVPSAVDQL